MKTKIEKLPKATFKLIVSIPSDKVKETYQVVLKEVAKTANIQGFRKGQAPINVVEDRANKSDLYGEVVNKLLEIFYPQALKENKISPIANPKVEIKEFDLEKDFNFEATVATKPEVQIKDYKKQLKNLKDEVKKEHEGHDHEAHVTPDDIVKKLIKLAKVEISDVLIDDEVNRMFSRFAQQIQAINMSIEDYLKSQNKTVEQLTEEYKKIAEESLKGEFILGHLINEEKMQISDEEVEEMISAVGDKTMMEKLQSPVQKIYIKSILAKNKLLTMLMEEVEGKKVENKEASNE